MDGDTDGSASDHTVCSNVDSASVNATGSYQRMAVMQAAVQSLL